MSAIRVPLLCAFAGGCLSGAVVLGLWRAEPEAGVPTQRRTAHQTELLATSAQANRTEPLRERLNELPQPSPAAQPEPATVASGSGEPHVASGPPPSSDVQDVGSAGPSPGGSAVSDVLTDLEAAYRQRLIAAARAEASAALEPTPAPTNIASSQAESATEIAARAIPPAAPTAAPAPSAAAPAAAPSVAVAIAAAPVVNAQVATAPAFAAQVDSTPAFAAQVQTRSPDIHIGDVNQNTYVSNVRQGDVYVMQQIAMLQYMQLFGASPRAGVAAPGRTARGVAAQRVPFPSTLTNPDNPWGFNFTPPNLVH